MVFENFGIWKNRNETLLVNPLTPKDETFVQIYKDNTPKDDGFVLIYKDKSPAGRTHRPFVQRAISRKD